MAIPALIAGGAAILGGAMASSGAKSAARTQAAAAKEAAELQYQQSLPWTVYGPGGYAAFDEATRAATYGMSPELQNLYADYIKQATELRGMMMPYYRRSRDIGMGMFDEYEAARQYTSGYDQLQRDLADTYFQRAAEQRGALAGYTPAEQATSYYEQFVAPDLLRSQERERLAQEQRLLSQGLLGSTTGGIQSEAVRMAQEASQRQARGEAFSQAQTYEDLMRKREAADIATAGGAMADIFGRQAGRLQGAQGMFANIGAGATGSLGQATGLLTIPGNIANLGQNIGYGMTGAAQAGAQLTAGAAQTGALTNAASSLGFGQSLANVGRDIAAAYQAAQPSYANNFNLPTISGGTGGSNFYMLPK